MSEQFSNELSATVTGKNDGYKTVIRHFSTYLKERGHSDGTTHHYRSALIHFTRWLTEKPALTSVITSRDVSNFLQEHLPVCSCPAPVVKNQKITRAALNNLLLMLGHERILPNVYKGSQAVEYALQQFDHFLRKVCGLTESTRLSRQRQVRRFLVEIFGTGSIDVDKITSKTLIKFVTDSAAHLKPSSVGVLLTALRSYLRFLQFNGESDIALAGSVPRPPNWSLSSLPPSLKETEMAKFWAAFNTSTTIGKRDYAMARCLADLGLRCHEVASMKIADINWRSGILNLNHNKTRREEQLPLFDITGQAIVDYLRNGRPTTSSRSIFVFHRAPVGRGVMNTTVRGAIRRAFSRAALPWTGTHILRHTAAAQMVAGGATLKEVADVLRHRSIDTTQIYTKVNLPELKHVAMPWPGRST